MKSIPTNKLKVSKFNVRKTLGNTSGLEDTIKSVGILVPLIVRSNGKKYEIVIGQRRFEAGKKVKLKEFPCIVRKMEDKEAIELSLIENIQQENLNPIELAKAEKQLLDLISVSKGCNQRVAIDILSDRIGRARPTIYQDLSLLNLDSNIQEKVIEEEIDIESASKISQFPKEEQIEIVSEIEDLPRDESLEVIKEIKKTPDRPIKKIKEEVIESFATYQITFSTDIRKALKQASESFGGSETEVIRVAVKDWLEKQGWLNEI